MKHLARCIIAFFVGGTLTGCPDPEILVTPNRSVQVLKGVRTVQPTERNLKAIGLLDKEGVAMLKQYIKSSKSQRTGYVIADYYIKIDNRIIGVVESNNSELIGFDISTADASRVPVTTTHTLLVCKNSTLAENLLKRIKAAK